MSLELALGLAETMGWKVFPVHHGVDNTKKPLTAHGHLDASNEKARIVEWWTEHPDAKVGVPTGVNGIVAADVDMKNGKDGWDSIDQNWLEIPETFSYETSTGGSHLVYNAPEGVELNGQAEYLGMPGVDRRGGSSWLMWVGGVPDVPLADAPEWLCDPAKERNYKEFAGTFEDWVNTLVPGEPNALVRRAIRGIPDDFSHSEVVEAQHHAIRLGCEGNPGVPELLNSIYERWMSRPAENHTTPEGAWESKWFEAIESGIEKYGALTDELVNLPEYSIGLVPAGVPDSLIVNENTGKSGFSQLLGALVKETFDDFRIASILWNAPATTELARDWGLQFVFQRIREARVRPEPSRENPRLEEERERGVKSVDRDTTPTPAGREGTVSLLSDSEREYLSTRPSFVNRVEATAASMSYDQDSYFRSIGWTVLAMGCSFKGFIPLSPTHRLGLNVWFINPGYSGTGKSVSGGFRDQILKVIFSGDPEDIVPFDLGDDSSPQGLHTALIERDHRASMFSSDEAAGFFESLGLKDWRTSVSERLTSWYNGYVQGSNKLSQKELRGKSALTSLNMHMFGTPEKLSKVITSDMFESGFMARVCWSFGNPPRNDSSRFKLKIDTSNKRVDYEEVPAPLMAHAMDVVMSNLHREKSVALMPHGGVMERLSEAYERMYRLSEGLDNWNLIEPSLTRLSESMMKMAGLCALYRGDDKIQMDDALRAVWAIEEYFTNLHTMADLVSAGDFQRNANAIEEFIKAKGGSATRAAIYHKFRGIIQKDSRELDSLLTFLCESGLINRKDDGKGVRYETNGG